MVGRNVYRITVDSVEICIQPSRRNGLFTMMVRKRKLRHVTMAGKVTLQSYNSLKLTPPPSEIVDRALAVSAIAELLVNKPSKYKLFVVSLVIDR